MMTGLKGTFVIPWSQTEIDGTPAGKADDLLVGATWRWAGEALRIDGPAALAQLTRADGVANLHLRAAAAAQRLLQSIPDVSFGRAQIMEDNGVPPLETAFTVSDGSRAWHALMIEEGNGPALLVFVDEIPPQGTELWVVKVASAEGAARRREVAKRVAGVICFAAGTMIATPTGPRAVETLGEGDLVLTRDDGPHPIQWHGARRMSGARLYAMPKLRPVRIRAGALGPDVPEGDLLVSPNHRLLIEGPAAQALFNTPEVLVEARDLEGTPGVSTDHALHEVTYVHLMLDRHQILFANGVPSESFHPAQADMAALETKDRARLLDGLPELEHWPDIYGPMARRCLNSGEAAILRHG